MKLPEITQEELKITVEQPDFMSKQCDEHMFYVKEFEGKGKLIVYAAKDAYKKYSIQCADWLVKPII
jgi:hypothetical protein